MLRDAAGFAAGNVGQADGVEQRGFAVIDVAHDGDHGRTRHTFGGGAFFTRGGVGDFFRRLFFEGDHVGVGSEEARHFAGQFGVERLVDGGEYAASQQARDQIFGADSELFRQILDADAFRNGDAARDRLRLVGERQPRRRRVALHRAFLHASRNVALSGPARRAAGTAARTGVGRRRQCAWADSKRTRARRRLPRGMHGPALARTQWRRERRAHRDVDAEKWAGPAPDVPEPGAWRPCRRYRHACGRSWTQRGLVHRTRPGLRHNHARWRRSRNRGGRWSRSHGWGLRDRCSRAWRRCQRRVDASRGRRRSRRRNCWDGALREVADATGAAVCTGTGGAGAGGGAGTVNVGLGVEVGTTNFGGAHRRGRRLRNGSCGCGRHHRSCRPRRWRSNRRRSLRSGGRLLLADNGA